MSWVYNVDSPLLANREETDVAAPLALHVSKRIRVTGAHYGELLGYVTVLGTTGVAERDAMDRAAKLAAFVLGYEWAIAWYTSADGGPIQVSISDHPNPGRTVARWEFVA